MADSEYPLQVRDLRKTYRINAGKSLEAVKGISFQVKKGECFGLLGPNGAGKSTTIQCISGFYPTTSGEVTINGYNVYENPRLARQFLGICPQDDTLDSDFTVFDQMVRHATFYKISVPEAKKRAQMLLERFDLQSKATEWVESLPGGMKRRLQVARALMSNPEVLVLDEPTTGLDPEIRRILWDVLVEYRAKGLAILLSTHYMEEAERLCDRVGIISQGKILEIDSPQSLIQKFVNVQVIEEEIKPGVVWKRAPNLEDVYLKVTGSKLGVHHS